MLIGLTGGNGYIASRFEEIATREGHDIKAIDINSSYPNKGDIINEDDLEGFLEGLDFVIHLAAISNVRECANDIRKAMDINVLSTRLLLDKLKDRRIIGMIYASSIVALYGNPEYTPMDEKHAIKPVNDYGVMKRSSELFCESYYRSYGVPVSIVRQSTVFGPAPHMNFNSLIHSLVKKCIDKEEATIFGNGMQKRNFLFVDDLIAAYLKIVKIMAGNNKGKVVGEAFNVAGPETETIVKVASMIDDIGQARGYDKMNLNFTVSSNEVDANNLKISIDKLKEAIGYTPMTTLKDGINKIFDHIEEVTE